MIIFGIECCTPHGSVALLKDGEILSNHEWTAQNTQGESVMPNVDHLLKSIHLKPSDLDLLAIDIGPGRFTGVRVGISIVKSLSFSLKKPIYVANSLELMAFDALACEPHKNRVLSVLNAYKNMLFTALYERTQESFKSLIEPCAIKIEHVLDQVPESTLCVGEGFKFFDPIQASKKLLRSSVASDHPKASSLVQMAHQNYKNSQLLDWKSLEPLYIRASEAEERLKSF